MPRRRPSPDDEEDEEEDEEDDEEDEPAPRRPPPLRPSRRGHRRPPVRRWSDEEEPDDAPRPRRSGARSAPDEPEEPRRGWFGRRKEPVYFRARDSIYFEPLVALAIIVILLVGMYAYTQNWPPMYVVESDSMQHGTTDQVGLINTGDLVLAQKIDAEQVVPYVVGMQTGYSTYGAYGDVLLYHPNGNTGGAPIIHRAILYILINSDGSASFPELQDLPCGNASGSVYSVSSTPSHCGTDHITGTLTLYHIGWRSVNVSVPLQAVGGTSGFLTMGDNNFDATDPSQGNPDQPFLSDLVQSAWIIGVARGMLPWFGSLKLLLDGNSAEVPANSWAWLGLTVVGLLVVALGLHYFLRAEGVEDPRRKAEEEAARAERGEQEPTGGWHWPHPLRGWGSKDEEEPGPRRGKSDDSTERHSWLGGRPKPSVGRSRSKRSKKDEDEEL